ncbi:unnamed protein product [Prunus armeniaca]
MTFQADPDGGRSRGWSGKAAGVAAVRTRPVWWPVVPRGGRSGQKWPSVNSTKGGCRANQSEERERERERNEGLSA